MHHRSRSEHRSKRDCYELLTEPAAARLLARQLKGQFTPAECATLLLSGADRVPAPDTVSVSPAIWRTDELIAWARQHGRRLQSEREKAKANDAAQQTQTATALG